MVGNKISEMCCGWYVTFYVNKDIVGKQNAFKQPSFVFQCPYDAELMDWSFSKSRGKEKHKRGFRSLVMIF